VPEQVEAVYRELAAVRRSPAVHLNRAVAVAEHERPEAALKLFDGLDLPDYQYFHSTRAELLRLLGRPDEARVAYGRALALAGSAAERRFLTRRLTEL
jgi:RNA polymerase sigma-70 factor (ECF subfamily)